MAGAKRKKKMIHIGIDPGDNTGFAAWDTRVGAFVEVETYPLHKALDRVKKLAWETHGGVHVVFEDARLRKWFAPEHSRSEYRGKLMGAGAAKRDAKIWEEFLTDYGIPFTAHKPQAGGTKWDKEYWQKVTGWTGRSSEHSRDAALLVWGMR